MKKKKRDFNNYLHIFTIRYVLYFDNFKTFTYTYISRCMEGKFMNNIQIDYKKLKNDTAIIITYVNKEGIQERTKLSLRKIKVMLITTGLTIATLVAGFALGKKVGENYQTRDEKNQESLANLDDNEEFIEEHLVAYNIALSDYENIMKQPNRNEHYAIEKRVEVISAIRNLQKVANNLMKVKVLEGLEITNPECKVEIERIKPGGNATPFDIINVSKNNEEVFSTKNIPDEISNILNHNEALNIYEGNGENAKWDDVIDKFIREGKILYNSILDLTTKNFIYENGNIECVEQNKTI